MKPVITVLLMSIFSLFVTSCGTDNEQVFQTSIAHKPIIKNVSAAPTKQAQAEPTHDVDLIPAEFVPSNPETWVNTDSGVLPALNNPLNPQDDSGADESIELASLSTLDESEKPKGLPDEIEQKETKFANELAESQALNVKLAEDNARLKGLTTRYESNENELRKELSQTKRALYEAEKNKTDSETGSALFLTIHQHGNQEDTIMNEELLVGVLSVPAQNDQKLGEFANVGSVTSNRSGTLTLRDTIPGEEGIVAQYELSENSIHTLTIPQDLRPVLGVVKDWGITFKPAEGGFIGTETTVLDFSLSGAALKNGSAPWVSDNTLRWLVKTPAPAPLITQSQTKQLAIMPIAWWQGMEVIATLAIILLAIILSIIIKIILTHKNKTKQISDGSRRIQASVTDPGKKIESPFTIVHQNRDDDIGDIDDPEPILGRKPTVLPPRREATILKPEKHENRRTPVKFKTILSMMTELKPLTH